MQLWVFVPCARGRASATSAPSPGQQTCPSLLRGLVIESSKKVWALDTTYIPIGTRFRLSGGRDRCGQPQSAGA